MAMAKRPAEHEPTVLRVEGLSDMGKRVDVPQPRVEACDLGGPPVVITPKPEPRRQKVAGDHREIARKAKAQREAIQLSMLVRLGLSDEPDPIPRPMVEVIPKGMRKIAEINGKAVLVPLAPWRR